jgi:hypothetical protein
MRDDREETKATAQLDHRAYVGTQEHISESAFDNEDRKESGIYVASVSGEPLFGSTGNSTVDVVEKVDTSSPPSQTTPSRGSRSRSSQPGRASENLVITEASTGAASR